MLLGFVLGALCGALALAVGIFVWVLTLPLPFGQFAARKPRGRLVRLWQSFAMRLANWLHKHID